MKNVLNRMKFVCGGEEGASNMEIIVWISVVLVIATVLFTFRGQITDFLTNAGDQVDALETA